MQNYEQIEPLGKCVQDNSMLHLVQEISSQKYFMAKKILIFEQSSDQEFIFSEAKMLKELNHPHILKHHDIFLKENDLVEVLEFCEYGDLFHYLEKKHQRKEIVSEKLIISWVMQILMALQYIHSKNIVHRLLTAQNIYLNHQGDLKIGSFGGAKRLENTMQKANTIIGEPCNMSPEMVQGNAYDSKSDIWSLGCLIFQMTTFQAPFKYGNLIKLYDSIVKQPCPELPVKYSKYLSPLYKKMMKKSPSLRPTATQLLCEPVFAKLMQEYLKKKRIDSIDLKRINPKPLIIHKKLSMQRKKQLSEPNVTPSSSRIKLTKIDNHEQNVRKIHSHRPNSKEKKLDSLQKTHRKGSLTKLLPLKEDPTQKQKSQIKKVNTAHGVPKAPCDQRKRVSSKGAAEQEKDQSFKIQKQDDQSKDKKIDKEGSPVSKQMEPSPTKSLSASSDDSASSREKQATLTEKNRAQIEYISLLYEVRLAELEEKYSPNMSKIIEHTQQFDSFKDLF